MGNKFIKVNGICEKCRPGKFYLIGNIWVELLTAYTKFHENVNVVLEELQLEQSKTETPGSFLKRILKIPEKKRLVEFLIWSQITHHTQAHWHLPYSMAFLKEMTLKLT